MAEEPERKRPGTVERLKSLVAEWGQIAIIVYFAIFFATLASFAAAIAAGFQTDGTGETLGLLGAAWLATKATQPLRIAAAALLTPVVGAVWHRTPWGRRRLQLRREREQAAAAEATSAALNEPGA